MVGRRPHRPTRRRPSRGTRPGAVPSAVRADPPLPRRPAVYPTHGTGSFCSAPGAGRTTTIGRERSTNPLLAIHEEDGFVARLLDGLGQLPDYFRQLPEVNRRGSPPRPVPASNRLTPQLPVGSVAARRWWSTHAPSTPTGRSSPRVVVESSSGRCSPPGSAGSSISTGPSCSSSTTTRTGPTSSGLPSPSAMSTSLAFSMVASDLDRRSPPSRATELIVRPPDRPSPVLDVRQDQRVGRRPRPRRATTSSSATFQAPVADGPVTVMCGHGERAMTGAGLLQRAGHGE